eukprot:TRINITY_DN2656_c0_g1_i1.p2 TRINITY_DN2656_c0_g1~~TRINITY_DN2656_c0_g1_i1.p2  ORF type:complete len:194 (-),score=27.01 TRINITY_DN2656_c0_g1_i1:158-739(-)
MESSTLLSCVIACLLISGSSAHHSSKYTWKDFKALGKSYGQLSAGMSGSEISGGDKKNHGGFMIAIYKDGSDYNIYYSGSIEVVEAGSPNGLGIFKGTKGSTGTLQFASLETWTNNTRTPKLKPLQSRVQFEYSVENIVKKTSTILAATGTLKALLDDMLANPKGYYAQVGTTKYTTGAVRGQFRGWKRRFGA